MQVVNIAVVEDEENYRNTLTEYIRRFQEEEGIRCPMHVFKNGMEFLVDFKPVYDVVFMDIEMPVISGLETAKHMRETDKEVSLIFVTRMGQYAINGYEVGALDFILKPVGYYNFSLKLKKAIAASRRTGKCISVGNGENVRKVNLGEVLYIEVLNHELVYHTAGGNISARGSLSEREKALEGDNFSRCNNCYLVNMNKIAEIRGVTLLLENGEELAISRSRKAAFQEKFIEFLGEKS